MQNELQQAADDPATRASLAIREVERLIRRDIETAERGLAHYRGQALSQLRSESNAHMQEMLQAEKKLLERVLEYLAPAIKTIEAGGS